MIDIPITMEQILALSNLHSFFQFIYLYRKPIYLCIAVTLMLIFFFKEKGKIKKSALLPEFVAITFFVTLIICALMSYARLNENQIKLIKSVDDNEFQALVLKSIKQNGLTIGAFESALNEFVPNEKMKKDIEFYNSVQP